MFPGDSVVKESTCSAGVTEDMASIPGWGRYLGEANGNPLQYSCLESPQGQRRLADYSPQGGKKWDTREAILHSGIGI